MNKIILIYVFTHCNVHLKICYTGVMLEPLTCTPETTYMHKRTLSCWSKGLGRMVYGMDILKPKDFWLEVLEWCLIQHGKPATEQVLAKMSKAVDKILKN